MPTILIIDDEELVIKSVERLLIKQGYKVFGCRSGKEALRIIEEENINLVVCDIRMPEINGIEIIKLIRESLRKRNKTLLPEILITGYADEETISEAKKLRVAEYMYKPFDLTAFLATIKKSLGD